MPLATKIPASAYTLIEKTTADLFNLIHPNYNPDQFQTTPLHPPFCKRCAAPINTTTHPHSPLPTCPNCTHRTSHLDWARSAYKETGTLRHAIIQFKYNRQHHWKPWIVDCLEQAFRQYAAHIPWHGIVPVPLHPTRQAERSFNQAQAIARTLSKRQRLPYLPCLKRTLPTPKQSLLNRAQRLANLTQAFQLKPKFDVHRLHLLIIDDVLTTAATAEACAKVLKQNGAALVATLVVARA
jgi:ComF family protein